MKKINYLLIALIAAVGSVFTSCSDDESTLSRAVLASVDILEFDAIPSNEEIIIVTSDGDWVSEAPDWVSVNPASGHAGQTEVVVSVLENRRDGAIDNPRKSTLIFKGRNLWSQAPVIIRQGGDKFRDPSDYSIDEMESVEDETVVRLPNMIVTTWGPDGFICTDGSQYAYVTEPSMAVEVGKKVSVVGEKWTNDKGLAYVKGERMTDEGTATVPAKTPVDITGTLDKTNGKKYQYVTITGDYDGTALKVDGNNCKVYFTNVNENLGVNKLAGHILKITGYYAGQAAPVVNVIPAEIEDLGAKEIVYLFDDFEYLEPWSAKGNDGGNGPAADIVGTDGANTEQPQISSTKCLVDGMTSEAELAKRGYSFTRNWAAGKTSSDCVYIQRNYLKFGKTSYQGGIVLPAIEEFGSGVEGVKLSMDVCSQRQGSGKWDPTELVIVIADGNTEVTVDVPNFVPENDAPYKWNHFEIELPVKITKSTRIAIRNVDAQIGDSRALRWHLDNLKLSSAY